MNSWHVPADTAFFALMTQKLRHELLNRPMTGSKSGSWTEWVRNEVEWKHTGAARGHGASHRISSM